MEAENFTPTSEDVIKVARFLRVALVQSSWKNDLLDRSQAEELLQGCLTPGDESTRYDDLKLLDFTTDQICAELGFDYQRMMKLAEMIPTEL